MPPAKSGHDGRLNLEDNKAVFVAPFILLLRDIRGQVASLEEFNRS